MTRNKACKIIARTNNVDELVEFFKHPNRHARHAARFKAYRLAPEDQRVADVITNISDDVDGWRNATEATAATFTEKFAEWLASPPDGDGKKPTAPTAKKVPALDPSYWWTHHAVQRRLAARDYAETADL